MQDRVTIPIEGIHSRKVSTSLRPARYAVLIDNADPNWMDTCLRVIELTSAIWGGWYSCIIPTDGHTIDKAFWDVLRCFDADHICAYQYTGMDLLARDPTGFEDRVQRATRSFFEKHTSTDETETAEQIRAGLKREPWGQFEIGDTLRADLFRRLTPFCDQVGLPDVAVTARPHGASGHYLLTSVSVLAKYLPEGVGVLDCEVAVPNTLRLAYHSVYGKLWPEMVAQVSARGVQADVQAVPADQLRRALSDAWWKVGIAPRDSPAALSLAGCMFYSPIEHSRVGKPAVVVVGDTVSDFCLYYAVSRMRGNAYWLPQTALRAYERQMREDRSNLPSALTCEAGYVRQLVHHLGVTRVDRRLIFASRSLGEDDLTGVSASIVAASEEYLGRGKHPVTETVRDLCDMVPCPRRLYEHNNADVRYRDQFADGESASYVNTPKPRFLSNVPPTEVYWLTDVEIEAYQVPRVPDLGPATVQVPNYGTGEVRVTGTGFAYICPYIAYAGGDVDAVLARPLLELKPPEEVIRAVFDGAGLCIQESDKGMYHRGCVARFGSLDEFADFLSSETNRRLLDRFRDTSQSDPARGAKIGDRRFLDMRAIARALSPDLPPDQGTFAESSSVARLVDELAALHVLHRGFVFLCQACHHADWYSITDVGMTFRCARCRAEQAYTRSHWKMPDEPAWYYQLDELVYQAYGHDGHVPALTLRALSRRARRSFLHTAQVEVRERAGDEARCMEIDLCCSIDGQLIVGEAKRAGRLDGTAQQQDRALTRYRELAGRLGASSVVLSTFADAWDAATVKRAQHALGVDGVEFLTHSDLLAQARQHATAPQEVRGDSMSG